MLGGCELWRISRPLNFDLANGAVPERTRVKHLPKQFLYPGSTYPSSISLTQMVENSEAFFPTQLGEYKVLKEIAEGTFGKVKCAYLFQSTEQC